KATWPPALGLPRLGLADAPRLNTATRNGACRGSRRLLLLGESGPPDQQPACDVGAEARRPTRNTLVLAGLLVVALSESDRTVEFADQLLDCQHQRGIVPDPWQIDVRGKPIEECGDLDVRFALIPYLAQFSDQRVRPELVHDDAVCAKLVVDYLRYRLARGAFDDRGVLQDKACGSA